MTNKSNSYTLTHRHTHTRPLCPKADPTLSNCRAPFNPPPPPPPPPPAPPPTPPPSQRPQHPPDLPLAPPETLPLVFIGTQIGAPSFISFFENSFFSIRFKSFIISKNRIAGQTSSRVVAPIFWRHFFNHVTRFTTSLSTGGRGNDASSDVTAHRSHGKGGG